MQNSQLAQLIRSFSGQEKRECRKFITSPYFNVREDVVTLYDSLCSTETPEKSAIRQVLFGDTGDTDVKLRLCMTYLMRLIERYLAQKEFESDETRQNLLLTAAYRKRGLSAFFERQRQWLEKQTGQQPLRDGQYYQTLFQLHWEAHQVAVRTQPTSTEHLKRAAEAADIAWLAQKLRFICLTMTHQSVYQSDQEAYWEKELVIAFAEQYYAHEPGVIALHLHCYRMLRYPEEEPHFQQFKSMLISQMHQFSASEINGLFTLAINYCVRRLNQGEKRFLSEVMDLYKPGIEQGILMENGEITPYTYYNIVAAGLQHNDLEWVDYFIHQYSSALKKQYRDSAFSFNLARLEYTRKQYDKVLELLQKVNYRDPLVNLSAKTLLLKTWYELGETGLLQSHLDAMRNFIHRKRILGYRRTNYLNIIKYTDKLINSNQYDKSELARLAEEIAAQTELTERDWLLEKILQR